MNLRGTTRGAAVKQVIPAEISNRTRLEEAIQLSAERLELYTKYQQTPAGMAARGLADSMILSLQYHLDLPLREFCSVVGVPVDFANEARAEMRGELKVWKLLKWEPERLERLLTKAKEEGTAADTTAKTWTKV